MTEQNSNPFHPCPRDHAQRGFTWSAAGTLRPEQTALGESNLVRRNEGTLAIGVFTVINIKKDRRGVILPVKENTVTASYAKRENAA